MLAPMMRLFATFMLLAAVNSLAINGASAPAARATAAPPAVRAVRPLAEAATPPQYAVAPAMDDEIAEQSRAGLDAEDTDLEALYDGAGFEYRPYPVNHADYSKWW